MTDIITQAKRLLENTTPGPWSVNYIDPDYADLNAAPAMENGLMTLPVLISDIYGEISSESDAELIAAAPELAALLAEETWEYQVQARSTKRPAWKASTNGVLQKWYGYEDVEEAKGNARMYTPSFSGDRGVEIRVLRRRVSNAEVME